MLALGLGLADSDDDGLTDADGLGDGLSLGETDDDPVSDHDSVRSAMRATTRHRRVRSAICAIYSAASARTCTYRHAAITGAEYACHSGPSSSSSCMSKGSALPRMDRVTVPDPVS